MHNTRSTSVIAFAALTITGIAGLSGTGWAGGFFVPYQSGQAIGTALAGCSARSDDAGFFFCNPATITGLPKGDLTVEARLAVPSIRIEAERSVSPLGVDLTAAGGTGNMTSVKGAPGAFLAQPLGGDLWLGLGVSGPFVVDIEANPGWAGRFHLLKSQMVGSNVSSALAWRAADWITIAAGMQAQHFKVDLRKSELIPTLFGPIETRGYLTGNDWALGAIAGVVLSPTSGTNIGIGYRSALTHRVEGRAGTDLPFVPVDTTRFDVDLPDVVSIGLSQRLSPAVRLFAEAQWVRWSRFKGFDIAFGSGRPNELRPQHWDDTWMGAIGFGYTFQPGTELTAGVHYDTPVTKGGANSLSPDGARTMLALGLNQRVTEKGTLSLHYAHMFFDDAPVQVSGPGSGTLVGTFKGSLDMIGASFRLDW